MIFVLFRGWKLIIIILVCGVRIRVIYKWDLGFEKMGSKGNICLFWLNYYDSFGKWIYCCDIYDE